MRKEERDQSNTYFLPQGSNIEKQVSIAEVKVVGFLDEHNLLSLQLTTQAHYSKVYFQTQK